MNVIDLLKKDHRTVEDLFSQFEQASEPKRKRAILDEIVRDLSVHAAIEEEVFYPAVQEALAERGDELVGESLREHADMKLLLADLDTASPGDARFDANVMRLKQEVEHHVQEEEGEVMPDMSGKVSQGILDDLGREAQQAKGRAPTRPHPHAPDQPPGIKAAGPVAAIIDRIRDAVTGRRAS